MDISTAAQETSWHRPATKVLTLGLTEEKKYLLRCMEAGYIGRDIRLIANYYQYAERHPEEGAIEFGTVKLCLQHS